MPRDRSDRRRDGSGGWQPLQGGQYPRQELHPRRYSSAAGTGGRQHRAVSEDARHSRSPGRAGVAEMRVARLSERLEALRRQMQQLKEMEQAIAEAPDHQVSLTDPDARAMATNGKGTGMVGYNVQTVVDAKHHLIVAHEVTNIGHDNQQLANMARQAKEVTGADGLTVLADRGYFSGEEVVACEAAGATPIVPKPLTSGAKASWLFAARRSLALRPAHSRGHQFVTRYPKASDISSPPCL